MRSGMKQEVVEDLMEEDEAPANLNGPGGPQNTSQGKRKRGKPIKDEDDEYDDEEGNESSDDECDAYAWIKQIFLDNFMCHNKCTVTLHEAMNFIGGQNGTGKSTILVAVCLGLGGQGKDGARADTLKDYVGPFANKAIIKITINLPKDNIPLSDFERMGKQLTIERTIQKAGQASFRILDARGKTRSTKRDHVKRICEHLSIQVDNPVQVMQQGMAKEFLHSCKANKFYEFFHRSTGLKDLAHELDEWKKTVIDLTNQVDANQASHETFVTEKYEPLKKEWEATTALRKLKEEIVNLEKEFFWSKTTDIQKEAEVLEEEEGEMREKIEKIREGFERKKETEGELLNRVKELKGGMEECKKRNTAVYGSQHKEAKDALTAAAKAVRMSQNEKKNTEKDIQEEMDRIRSMEKEIDKLQQGAAKKGNKPVSCLREVNAKLEIAVQKQPEAWDECQKYQKLVEEYKQEKDQVTKQVSYAQGQMESAKQTFDSFGKNTGANALSRFGNGVQHIADDVERNKHLFRGKVPIGPIGKYIALKDEKWKYALADTLKPQICQTYLCEGKEQADKLNEIIRKNKSIAASARIANKDDFGEIYVYGSEKTLLDVIEISHPDPVCKKIIINFLIDESKINELRLVDSYQKARQNTAVNAQETFRTLPNGVRHKLNRNTYFSEDGKMCARKLEIKGTIQSSQSLDQNKNYFTLDQGAALQDARRVLDNRERYVQEVRANEAEVQRKYQQASRDLLSSKKELKKVQTEIEQLEKKQKEEQEKEEEEEDSEDPCTHIRHEILGHQDTIRTLRDSLSKIDSETAKLREVEEEASAAFEKIKGAANAALNELQDYKAEYEGVMTDLEVTRVKIQKDQQKIADQERRHAEGMKALANKKVEAEEAFKMVSDMYPDRIDSDKGTDNIKKEMEKKKRILAEKQGEQRKDVRKIEMAYLKAHKEMTDQSSKAQANEQMLKIILSERKKRSKAYKNRRKRISNLVQSEFQKVLSVNKYAGKLNFNHDPDGAPSLTPMVDPSGQSLDDQANPHKKQKTGEPVYSNVKELSGGEKSFSTLAFVMALSAQSMGSMLALDEFDVFMDEKNRNLCFSVLCAEMRSKRERQLIVISPHTMAILNANDNHDIKRITMTPIDRSQRAIRE